MGVLLDLVYLSGLGLASPWLAYKAVTRPRHVRGLRQRLGLEPPRPAAAERPTIWLHGVSVGEILAAKTFVKALGEAFPGFRTVLSTTTSTGQEVARKTYPDHQVFYFPADFSWSVRRVFEAIKPSLIVLVELELWPNFLEHAQRAGVPVTVVNGRISARSSHRYGLAPGLVRRMFHRIAHYGVQTEDYAERFRSLGVPDDRITVTGTMKYDAVRSSTDIDVPVLRERLGLAADAPVLIGGSTHPGEEAALLAAFQTLRQTHDDLRLVLVPRHNERSDELERELVAAGETVQRFSTLDKSDLDSSGRAPVILVDVMGELGRLYGVADICFVGGSLIRHGGQNILEPAGLGKPVVFGPHCFNFQESVDDLLAEQAAIQVADQSELTRVLGELLAEPERARSLGERALDCLERKRGATARTIELLSKFTGQVPAGPQEELRL